MEAQQIPKENNVTSISKWMQPIKLNWKHKDRKVIVEPDDDYRFTATVEEAIRACQSNKGFADFQKQFKKVLVKLAIWIEQHQDKISQAFITTRDACLLFVVIQKEKKYDRKFEDDLTKIDLKIAQDNSLSDIKLNVIALPNSSLEAFSTFLSPEITLQYQHAR